MYIMITDKCNMLCEHCGFACTNRGSFMTKRVFTACCKVAQNIGDWIFLGGGEPTLHPRFMEFLGMAILYNGTYGDMPSGLITNGTNTQLTLNLLHAAHAGAIFCEVSLDMWHDESMVDQRVIDLATRYKLIRKIDEPISIGRASNIVSSQRRECICDDIFVDVKGNVYTCGCRKTKIGSIFDKDISKHIDLIDRDIDYLITHPKDNQCLQQTS